LSEYEQAELEAMEESWKASGFNQREVASMSLSARALSQAETLKLMQEYQRLRHESAMRPW
jgi:hypothetical protein